MKIQNNFHRRLLVSLVIFLAIIITTSIFAIGLDILIAVIKWFQVGFFVINWQDISNSMKMGLYGGGITGAGLALLYLFKVKGF